MRIPLRSGRYFSKHDTKDSPHVAVINEVLAHLYWPTEDAVGRFMEMAAFGAGHCQIVGTVADIRQTNLSDEPAPGIYIPYTQEPMPWQTLVVRTKNAPMGLAGLIRHEVAALDPEQPVARVVTLDELMEASTAQPRFRTFLLGSFVSIALLLSAIGIYGVMAYTVSRRTREVGVRMALGARPVDILKLIFGESMTLTLLGVGFGLVGAYAVTRIMRTYSSELPALIRSPLQVSRCSFVVWHCSQATFPLVGRCASTPWPPCETSKRGRGLSN